jgi:hypothetical protein
VATLEEKEACFGMKLELVVSKVIELKSLEIGTVRTICQFQAGQEELTYSLV